MKFLDNGAMTCGGASAAHVSMMLTEHGPSWEAAIVFMIFGFILIGIDEAVRRMG